MRSRRPGWPLARLGAAAAAAPLLLLLLLLLLLTAAAPVSTCCAAATATPVSRVAAVRAAKPDSGSGGERRDEHVGGPPRPFRWSRCSMTVADARETVPHVYRKSARACTKQVEERTIE